MQVATNENDDAHFRALLAAAAEGDIPARDEVVEAVYRELHRRASRLLSLEGQNLTLQTTALVNETLLRFLGEKAIQATDRNHFLNTAAQQMRRVLVDRARARYADKRKGINVSIEDAGQISIDRGEELVALDDALKAFAEVDPQAAKIVELKHFGGFTDEETAEILQINFSMVRREWEYARAWLHDYLTQP